MPDPSPPPARTGQLTGTAALGGGTVLAGQAIVRHWYDLWVWQHSEAWMPPPDMSPEAAASYGALLVALITYVAWWLTRLKARAAPPAE